MINVLLVDDHELVRAGIRRILEDIKGIKVVGESCCGEDAVKWCRANSVDVVLMDMNEMVKSMIFGGEPENLLHEKLDIEAIENPMFCLTNTQKMNGASLLLQEDIRKQIGECLGSDYFVLPSSIHEVLILPDNGMLEVPELNAMVKEVNETQVERQEQLSDKVQFCDGKTAVMENAERRETRLEKAKEAEKVTAKTEAKGGIHGKLEKAKAEIKAKGADTIPKDKAKDLATVL